MVVLTIENIRAASTDAGNRYMRDHPEERPNGSAAWTRNAYDAAVAEFHRLCKAAGLSPYVLPR
jgi:hypothetical protein